MKIVRNTEKIEHQNNKVCKAFEYPMADKDISGAIIELTGRYPDKDYATNLEVKEMAYVIKGSGKLVVNGKEEMISEGDLIIIEPKEKFYWEGNMILFMPCTPAWTPDQHKETA